MTNFLSRLLVVGFATAFSILPASAVEPTYPDGYRNWQKNTFSCENKEGVKVLHRIEYRDVTPNGIVEVYQESWKGPLVYVEITRYNHEGTVVTQTGYTLYKGVWYDFDITDSEAKKKFDRYLTAVRFKAGGKYYDTIFLANCIKQLLPKLKLEFQR